MKESFFDIEKAAKDEERIHKLAIKCPSPDCMARQSKRIAHSTAGAPPVFMPDAIAQCEWCGGYTNGTDWKHVCKHCGKEVAAGELKGFFVPHRCAECDAAIVAKQRAEGDVCGLCGSVRSYCCC